MQRSYVVKVDPISTTLDAITKNSELLNVMTPSTDGTLRTPLPMTPDPNMGRICQQSLRIAIANSETPLCDNNSSITASLNEEKSDEKTDKIDNENGQDLDVNSLNLIDENDMFERDFLFQNGYVKIENIANTLQGSVFIARQLNFFNEKKGRTVVIKRASKILHSRGITIQNGKKYSILEDISKEHCILKYLNSFANCPSQIIKLFAMIETKSNYYLIMENGGKSLFDFVVRAHALIDSKLMSVREYRKFVKYLFYQMVLVIDWLHNSVKCCHLDISLENTTVLNGNFILNPKSGKYTVDPKITIRICDFGLSEFFADESNDFDCNKYVGKSNYKAPEVYNKKRVFDARKADVWSLSVMLFCMSVGAPPYNRPCKTDDAYNFYIRKGAIDKLLFGWNRHWCLTTKLLNLLQNMMCVDCNKRIDIKQVLLHPWLKIYNDQYKGKTNANNNENNNGNTIGLKHALNVPKLPKVYQLQII